MKSSEIQEIISNRADSQSNRIEQLIETHISWVLLTSRFAYKIKKPIRFSFLDFSTLDKRKYYCEREIMLNQRLTDDMYLDLVPIRLDRGSLYIDETNGIIVDYAVKMRRMPESRRMNYLLEKDEVTFEQMEQVADKLGTFHAYTDVIEVPINTSVLWEDFSDISKVMTSIGQWFGTTSEQRIKDSIIFVGSFLNENKAHLEERHAHGFTIDGHGDLHSKNIFLLEEPVIFDCIEFNDHLRQVDVLNDIAFFIMDLEFYGEDDLAIHFLQNYLINYPCIRDEKDERLFLYYKLYRANIKVKINALKAIQAKKKEEREKRKALAEDYLELFKRYFNSLQEFGSASHPSIYFSA
jgi:aminoglycoside phosphotransferase family enzyme